MLPTASHDPSPVRVAFLASGGGGAIDGLCRTIAAGDAQVVPVGVVTDRICGAEHVARTHGLRTRRIAEDDDQKWSARAAELLESWRVDAVVLLFLRRVETPLLDHPRLDLWNLHPSVLPSYPGIAATRRSHDAARAGRDRVDPVWMGTTLHVVTGVLDAGPVIGQGRFTLADAPTVEDAGHLSYLLKVMLACDALAARARGRVPAIPHRDLEQTPWRGDFRPRPPRDALIRACRPLARPRAADWLDRLAGVTVQ